jgi:hypothetical protein
LSYEGGDIELFDLFRWFVGGSTLEKMETEDGLQIYSQDLMKWEDKRRDFEEQFKDMQTNIIIYLNA